MTKYGNRTFYCISSISDRFWDNQLNWWHLYLFWSPSICGTFWNKFVRIKTTIFVKLFIIKINEGLKTKNYWVVS